MKLLYLTLIATMASLEGFTQTITNPKELFDPAPYAFSHLVSLPEHTQLLFIAGQGGEENTEGKLSNDFRKQVRQSLYNIRTALKTQGAVMSDVVKVTTLVVDHDQEKLNIIVEEFNRLWPDKKFPVNTLIPVPRLAIAGMLVEIDAVAVKRSSQIRKLRKQAKE